MRLTDRDSPPTDAPKNFTTTGPDFARVPRITERLHQAGVPLLAGTDANPAFGAPRWVRTASWSFPSKRG